MPVSAAPAPRVSVTGFFSGAFQDFMHRYQRPFSLRMWASW